MKLLYFYNRPSGQKKGFGVHRLVTSKLLIDLVLFIIRSEIKFFGPGVNDDVISYHSNKNKVYSNSETIYHSKENGTYFKINIKTIPTLLNPRKYITGFPVRIIMRISIFYLSFPI